MKKANRYFKTNLFLASVLCLSAIQNPVIAQDKIAKIDKLMHQYVESGCLNGAVLVAEKGSIIYKKAFGMADLEWDIPNTVDTKFRIYSMSKQFTALLVMQLVEKGKLKLENPISEYLPYYRKDIGRQVTIHQLLTHTHGIIEPTNDQLPFLITEPVDKAVTAYFSQDLEFQPGSKFRYSGLGGYVILGAILEQVTGKKYESLLKENILDKIEMKNTEYLNFHTLIKKRATDYRRTDKGLIHRIQPYPVHANGASSIVSTVDDLFLWDQALYTEKLISRKYLDLLFTPHVKTQSYQYGYGWYVEDLNIAGKMKRIINHTGGSVCIIFRDMENQNTVILLNNVRSDKLLEKRFEICVKIFEIKLSQN